MAAMKGISNDRDFHMLHPETEPAPKCLEEEKEQHENPDDDDDWEHWSTLGRFVNDLTIADVETKARILKHLCWFLFSSAATFSCPSSPAAGDDIAVSAVVDSRRVSIKYDDVLDMQTLLFQELSHYVPSLVVEGDMAEEGRCVVFPSTKLELKVTALALRCCIRLLPLIELFDTGLRNAAGVALDRLLQKLCSPREPCLLQSVDCGSDKSGMNVGANRSAVLCVLLEVYLDELLSQPKTQFLLLQDNCLEKETRSTLRITLEATLAHVMISVHLPTQPHGQGVAASELSLQSAVSLLDRAITNKMPRYLLSHVTNMVCQSLEEHMTISKVSTSGINTDQPKKWFSRFTYSGCYKNLAGRLSDKNMGLDPLSWQVQICLVSSILERAVSLYMEFASAPHLAYFGKIEEGVQQPGDILSNSLLGSCLWNYVNSRSLMSHKCEVALESMLNDATVQKGLKESIDQTCWNTHGLFPGDEAGHVTHHLCKVGYPNGNIERVSGTHSCGRELCSGCIWEEDCSTLVADVLHLMHSSLDFVSEKAQMLRQELQDCPASDITQEDLDNILFGLIGAFHECLPPTSEITASESVGRVLVFFTDMLYYEAENTITDSRLQKYLELLESLSIAWLMEETWRRIISTSPQVVDSENIENEWLNVDTCRHGRFELRSPPGSYAREVVGLLQGFIEEPDILEILGENAVSLTLQINYFLNDFCEYMDNVLYTSTWREIISPNGRRIMRKQTKILQNEVNLIDSVKEEVVDLKDHPWEEEQSPAVATAHPEDQTCSVIGQVEEVQQPCSWEEEQKPADAKTPLDNQACSMKGQLGGQQLRPSTLPILQKLMKYRTPVKTSGPSPMRVPSPEPEVEKVEKRPVRKCRQPPIVEPAAVDSTEPDENDGTGNPYVAEVLLLEKTSSKESFDDLKDFIVCKRGRSYTKWLNRRSKFRRRKRTREIWKRAEDKKKLLSMLNIV